MTEYDGTHFDPPAPVTSVTLRNLETGKRCGDVPMVLDSGSDVTLVPQLPASRIGITPTEAESYQLASFDGSISLAPCAKLDLAFLDKTYRGRYLLIDREIGILGRDILNLVSLFLNGPGLTWSEQDAS